jgi:hypothetical protein
MAYIDEIAKTSKFYSEIYVKSEFKILFGLLIGLIGALFCYFFIFWHLKIIPRLLITIFAVLIFRSLSRYGLDLFISSIVVKILFFAWLAIGIYNLYHSGINSMFTYMGGTLRATHNTYLLYAEIYIGWVLLGIFLIGAYARIAYVGIVVSYSIMKSLLNKG